MDNFDEYQLNPYILKSMSSSDVVNRTPHTGEYLIIDITDLYL